MFLRDSVITNVAVGCLLLTVVCLPINACSCDTLSEKDYYCSSDNVLKVTVLNQLGGQPCISEYNTYNVSIDQVFKSNLGLNVSVAILSTPCESYMCPLFLAIGSQYLLSVSKEDNGLTSTACSWVRVWDTSSSTMPNLSNEVFQSKCARGT